MTAAGPYVRVAGRFRVNVAVLTGAGTMGNYNMHATVRVVVEDGVYEVPALTGNAFKHWHSVRAAEHYRALGGGGLNEYCAKGVGLRGKNLEGKNPNSECDAIQDFCNDIHGFLIPDKQLKRDSLVKFAFAVPVLSRAELERAQKFAVTHNRVDPFRREKAEQVNTPAKHEKTEMMVFKQEYSSARYGFSASLDLGLVLAPMYDNCSVNVERIEEERALRRRAAVLGLFDVLSSGVGTRAARALPAVDLEEVVVAVSKFPIPALVHGSYPNYVDKSLDVLSAFAKVYGKKLDQTASLCGQKSGSGEGVPCVASVVCYGVDCREGGGLEVKKVEKFHDLVEDVLSAVLQSK